MRSQNRFFRHALMLGLAFFAPTHLSAQQTQPTVAVLDFTAFSLTLQDAAPVGKGVAGMLITEMDGRPGFRVIERQQIRSLLDEQRLALSGRVDEQTALQIGRLLGAQYLVTGNIALAQQARLDVRVFRVETGEIVRAQKLTGNPDDFLSLVVQIADQFTRDLQLQGTAGQPVARSQVQIPMQALLAYSRGLDYEDEGELDRSIEMYRQALQIFPEYGDAAAALERVTNRRGGRS